MAAPVRMALDAAWQQAEEAQRRPVRARGPVSVETQVRKALSDNCWMMTDFQRDGLLVNGAVWDEKFQDLSA